MCFFFFKQKTAYEMRISDWSSDVCSSDLSLCGASYQGVFRNPLADPYLLGAAAGAGLGVTFVIVGIADGTSTPGYVPIAAFVGALGAVALAYALGAAGGGRASTEIGRASCRDRVCQYV